MSELHIRPFAEGDGPLVEAFFDQMGGETRAFFDRAHWNRNNAMAFFAGTAKDTAYFLAELDGIMVGYLFLNDIGTGVPGLGIAVHEGYKGRHLGRELMQYAIDYARQTQKGGILLTTHVANLRGQALYERMGFARIGVENYGEILYLLRL